MIRPMTVGIGKPGPKSVHAKVEQKLREFALGYPETTEELPWGHRSIKVRKKAFLFIGCDKRCLSLSVKLPRSRKSAERLLTKKVQRPRRASVGEVKSSVS